MLLLFPLPALFRPASVPTEVAFLASSATTVEGYALPSRADQKFHRIASATLPRGWVIASLCLHPEPRRLYALLARRDGQRRLAILPIDARGGLGAPKSQAAPSAANAVGLIGKPARLILVSGDLSLGTYRASEQGGLRPVGSPLPKGHTSSPVYLKGGPSGRAYAFAQEAHVDTQSARLAAFRLSRSGAAVVDPAYRYWVGYQTTLLDVVPSPSGRVLYGAEGNDVIRLTPRAGADMRRETLATVPGSGARALVCDRAGNRLYVAFDDGTIRTLNLKPGAKLRTVSPSEGAYGPTQALWPSRDESMLYSVSGENPSVLRAYRCLSNGRLRRITPIVRLRETVRSVAMGRLSIR